tara:strand:+ start:309 stop:794 length:486 start_codon:yes stop_codon:yes gene_type:complete
MKLKNTEELTEALNTFKQNTMYNPELVDAVLEQMDFDLDDWENLEHNFINASDGWLGFHYCSETTEFFDKNKTLIFDALREYEEEVSPLQKPEIHNGETNYKNWMAWFACEAIIFDLKDFKFDIIHQYNDLDQSLTKRREQEDTLNEAKYILEKANKKDKK